MSELHSFYFPNRVDVSLDFTNTELITKQEFKDECDINNIVTQFQRTGVITHIMSQQPEYIDLPDQMDYQQSLAVMEQAQAAFQTLPSLVRRYFDNDPSELLAAIGDPSQRQVLEEFGILKGPGNPAPLQPPGNPANESMASQLRTAPELPSAMPPAAPGAADPAQPA